MEREGRRQEIQQCLEKALRDLSDHDSREIIRVHPEMLQVSIDVSDVLEPLPNLLRIPPIFAHLAVDLLNFIDSPIVRSHTPVGRRSSACTVESIRPMIKPGFGSSF